MLLPKRIWKDIPGYEGLYQVSNDGKVRSLDRIINYKDGRARLEKGHKFSDGTEVTAKDVKFTFATLADPSYAGPNGGGLENLVGYKEYNKFPSLSIKTSFVVVEPASIPKKQSPL